MEPPASFDLNRAIHSWRENLATSPSFRGENLDELESHLRDSVDTLQSRGLSTEEAFLIANKRIGGGTPLQTEFSKVNGSAIWLDRIFWMLIGYQIWVPISGTIGLITRNALSLGLYAVNFNVRVYDCVPSTAMFTLVHLAGFAASLALCWWVFCRKGRRFSQWFETWLQRRGSLALLFGGLYLLSLSVNCLNGGMQALIVRFIGREKISDFYYVPQAASILIATLILGAVFPLLTLLLARKRLRLRQT